MRTKRHPGRPALPKNRIRARVIGVRFAPDTVSKLNKYSNLSGIPKSQAIRNAVKAFLEKEMGRAAA